MTDDTSAVTFHRSTEIEAEAPTLIEGLPGHGLVASIAVDQITDQLGLEQYGSLRSERFPPVTSFADGLVQDTVRVYGGTEPDVLTLQSDVPIPEDAFTELGQCVLAELVADFGRAIFLAGAPAQSEEQQGEVVGVATTEDLKTQLEDAGIELAEGTGAVGGVTGALVTACYQADVPVALLLVRANPRLPDPAAARSVIENALEPLVEFEIDTEELREQAAEIQTQKQQVAQQLQQAQDQDQQEEPMQARNMFR
ncbi:proteasome assembly chaperone family protein [Natronorubrum sp. JWXQ-INN-674]|uniref:Proteasome assembly chaperone family protein n=1 Tax=Natronorubrum halalkaliphilum TaxID=2691917 RepID=A0A6B0VKA6_9EURY|nr:PAC2 family protein [Natronorubrum halalkaliphilum]MXV60989.1 proteasome assembly chaperone family protein [Natronorubrum halalkaliphilum]